MPMAVLGKRKTALDEAMAYYEESVKGHESDENVTYRKFYGDDGDRYVMVGTDGSWEFASDTGVEKMWNGILKDIYETIANEAKEEKR